MGERGSSNSSASSETPDIEWIASCYIGSIIQTGQKREQVGGIKWFLGTPENIIQANIILSEIVNLLYGNLASCFGIDLLIIPVLDRHTGYNMF